MQLYFNPLNVDELLDEKVAWIFREKMFVYNPLESELLVLYNT